MRKSFAASVVLVVFTLVLVAASAFAARDAAISFEFRNHSRRTITRIYAHDTSAAVDDWDADDIIFNGEIDPGESVVISFIPPNPGANRYHMRLRAGGENLDYPRINLGGLEVITLLRDLAIEDTR